jgi:hypothetical protein
MTGLAGYITHSPGREEEDRKEIISRTGKTDHCPCETRNTEG